MFRRPSGGIGFSWNRLVTNAVPNFANNNPERDADLTLAEQDLLWTHQTSGAVAGGRSPMTLDGASFLRAGVTNSESVSNRIYQALFKNGILKPDGIDTTRVTPQFAHQLAFISVAAQRKVIGMLFFWEEEIVRWRLLDDEEQEIRKVMGDAAEKGGNQGALPDLQLALESVRMRRGMRPSRRLPGAIKEGEELPEYQARG